MKSGPAAPGRECLGRLYRELKMLLSAQTRAEAFEQRARAAFEGLQDARWRGDPVRLVDYKNAKQRYSHARHILVTLRQRIASNHRARGALLRSQQRAGW